MAGFADGLKGWALDKLRSHGEAIVYRASGLPLACGLGCPRDTPPSLRALRAAYRRHYRRSARGSQIIDLIVALLIFVPGILLFAVRGIVRNGTIIAARTGKSRPRQFVEQLVFAVRSGILPPWYYVFELYRPEQARRAAQFIGRGETKEGIYHILGRCRHATTPLGDKLAFARHCALHALHTVQPIAVARAGRLVTIDAGPLPDALFVKPVRASGGSGAWRLDRDGAGGWRSGPGERLSTVQALQRFADRSRLRPLMLQPRLRNHPGLVDLANGALSTARLLTCLDEEDRPELVGAAFRMAIGGNHVVDNLHAGGLAAAIDLATGRLSCATDLGVDVRRGRVDRHPTSGAAIVGRRLPFWAATRALGLSAHAAFCDHVLVGWDIAILEDGPIIVEGNSGPDLDIMQRVLDAPLGRSRLAALLCHHLARRG